MARKFRQWTGAETRLVSEYLAAHYGDRTTAQRVRVGRIPYELPTEGLSPSEIRALGIWRRWVDAVVWLDREVLLIEAGIRPDLGDVSKLEGYSHLFPMTPEFAEYADWPVRGMLLYAIDDPVIHRLAQPRGFTITIFCPAWVDGYLLESAPHLRRSPLSPFPPESEQ